uniref:Gustatory receptor n=1 Tax=Anopheles dirus TaxID=7168 RepID=A0A182N7P6_9DIPT
MSDTTAEKRWLRLQLYQTFKPYLICAQLLCTAPSSCNAECLIDQRSQRSYFKQARLLITASILTSVVICGVQAIVQLIYVPMPFFTGVLYVNEVVLCIAISVAAVNRGLSEEARCNRFVDTIIAVASAVPYTDWVDTVRYVRLRLQGICATFVIVFALALLCDYLHFGSIYATLFTLCAYLLPNVLGGVSIVQYCLGTLLVYRLQQNINRRLSSVDIIHEAYIVETKHHYLQLAHSASLLTRSYEVLILTIVFAGINVTSLQLLEIYQYLQQGESHTVYLTYNILWIFMQLYMLLIVVFPSDMFMREQTRFGMVMFERVQTVHEPHTKELVRLIARLGLLTLGRKKIVSKACGVLRLELSSLSSIFVALLSFMIILIQFDSGNLNKHNGAVTAIDSLYTTTS